jgi:hypothetical protein
LLLFRGAPQGRELVDPIQKCALAAFVISGKPGYCSFQLRCCLYHIEFAFALLDPPCADMALYRHPDMVRAIAGACRV